MKKALNIILIVIVAIDFGYSQSSEELRFYDSSWERTDKLRKVFYIKNISIENDSSYQIKVFNNSGNLMMKGYFSKLEPMIPNGYFEFYNINTTYDKCTGYYLNGEIVGEWKIFHNDSTRILNYDSINSTSCKELDDYDSYPDVFITYEDYASFRGRDPGISFREYIVEERFYPPFEELFHITGRVIIEFIIDKNGNVCKPKIVKNISTNFDKEALRILNNSPNWDPVHRIEMFTFPFWFDYE